MVFFFQPVGTSGTLWNLRGVSVRPGAPVSTVIGTTGGLKRYGSCLKAAGAPSDCLDGPEAWIQNLPNHHWSACSISLHIFDSKHEKSTRILIDMLRNQPGTFILMKRISLPSG
jgi:hypothetical protein